MNNASRSAKLRFATRSKNKFSKWPSTKDSVKWFDLVCKETKSRKKDTSGKNTNASNNKYRENARRELRYVVTPQANKDYDNDNTAQLTFDISVSQVRINVTDTTNFDVKDRIVIDSEVMQIKEIPDATTLVVKRGFSKTIKSDHRENTKVNKLTTADDALVEAGDDFGFNEVSSIFTDSLQFNPATRTDS